MATVSRAFASTHTPIISFAAASRIARRRRTRTRTRVTIASTSPPSASFFRTPGPYLPIHPRPSNLFAHTSSSFPSSPAATDYQFFDGNGEVELRLDISTLGVASSRDVFVDTGDTSLLVRVKAAGGNLITLMDARLLFERIKPSETIWYIDEDQLVVNLKKFEVDLKWPDIKESWESLSSGISQMLKGTSIYVIGESTEMNQAVANKLASGIGYTPLSTSELLEKYVQGSIDSWVAAEGTDSVADAESVILESLSSHVRTVVATLGGPHGAASRSDKWRHLHAGFAVWLSKSDALDEASAKEEAQKHLKDRRIGYGNADVVVKIGGWDLEHVQDVAQGCLSALKQLTLADKQLAGKKSLYIRLGCRGDWPNIKPPGWDPSSGDHVSSSTH